MKLCVVAGEASGDLHAAKVIHALRRVDHSLRTFGIGGDRLAGEGMELLHHAREMAIVGLFNVLRHLKMFRRVFDELIERIEQERPDAVLLVDYPDFNLRVARRVKAMGIRVVYYISPQVWAWRRGRVKQIARMVDLMMVIFPFEEDFYRRNGIPAIYVGHPLIDELEHARGDDPPDAWLRIALLPGSRHGEVESLLPAMLDAVDELRRDRDVDAFVIQAPTIGDEQLREMIGDRKVRIVRYDRGESLARADVALSSSGTATLECAIVGVPVVVMYRLSPATYVLARRLVKLRHFSLVNIIAGKQVVPELLQSEVNGERIAGVVRDLIRPETYADVLSELREVRTQLGSAGASERAATEILRMLRDAGSTTPLPIPR